MDDPYDANHRSYVEDKLSKNMLASLYRDPKDLATKPKYNTELYRHANFHTDRREISVPGKNTYFSLHGKPTGGGLPSHANTFYKTLVELILISNIYKQETHK